MCELSSFRDKIPRKRWRDATTLFDLITRLLEFFFAYPISRSTFTRRHSTLRNVSRPTCLSLNLIRIFFRFSFLRIRIGTRRTSDAKRRRWSVEANRIEEGRKALYQVPSFFRVVRESLPEITISRSFPPRPPPRFFFLLDDENSSAVTQFPPTYANLERHVRVATVARSFRSLERVG